MADSIRDLWQLISGKAVHWPDELLSAELNGNKDKLLHGLNYFKSPSGPAKLENFKKKFPPLHLNFIAQLAQFLNLDEMQTYNVYQLYLLRSFTGSERDMQEILMLERSALVLMEKIRDFYFMERIYLLRCTKHILTYCNDPLHPHYEVFREFAIQMLEGDKFLEEVKKQFVSICDNISSLCSWSRFDQKLSSSPMEDKAKQKDSLLIVSLREKCEILEVLLLYYKHSDHSPEALFDLFNIFKKQGFSGGMGFRGTADASFQLLLNRIGFLQMLIIVGGLQVELLLEKYSDSSPNRNVHDDGTVMKAEHYKFFNDAINNLGDHVCLSPLLLAWAVVRHLKKDGTFVKVGDRALQMDVFGYIDEMLLETSTNRVESSIEVLMHDILYGLINSVLSIFHESTLGNTEHLYSILNQFLRIPYIADAFWSLSTDEGVRSLLTSGLGTFPVQFIRPMEILVSLIGSGACSLQQVVHLLQNLTMFSDTLDRTTALMPTSEGGLYRLSARKKPTLYPDCRVSIAPNTLGRVLSDPTIDGTKLNADVISWLLPYDGFDVLLAEISNMAYDFESGRGSRSDVIRRVTLVMKLIGEGLKVNSAVMKESLATLDCFIEGALELLQRFSSATTLPPSELMSSCLRVLMHGMDIFPVEIWRGIQASAFLPHFSYHVRDFGEAAKALNSGRYGQMLMSRETVEGSFLVSEAFLELLLLCIDFPALKEFLGEMVAPLLFVCQEMFPTHHKWKYSTSFSSEKIGLLCMKIFKKVLDMGEETPLPLVPPTTTGLEAPRLSPGPVVMNGLLFSEAGSTLLYIANTGAEEIAFKLANQNSDFNGEGSDLIELIKNSLYVLNHLLTKQPALASSSPYLGRALSTTPGSAGLLRHQTSEEFLGFGSSRQQQSSHLIKSVVLYINHRHDCSLPVQATVLLKNLASIFPLSMLACLSGQVDHIKEIYLERLQTNTDGISLKVAILEWLTACIQNQPGLVEIFINDDKNGHGNPVAEPIKSLFSSVKSTGETAAMKSKCLTDVAKLIRKEKQGTYGCPKELLCAALEFVHCLWKEYQINAMIYLKKLNTFWDSLFNILSEENVEMSQQSANGCASDIQIKLASHVFRVFALEVYHTERLGEECKDFVSRLNSAIKSGLLLKWSKFVQRSLTNVDSCPNAENLLLAWRDLVVVLAAEKTKKNLSSSLEEIEKGKDAIVLDLIEVLNTLMASPSSSRTRMLSAITSFILILINRWCRTLSDQNKLVESSCDILDVLLGNPGLQKCHAPLVSLTSALVIIFKGRKITFLPDAQNCALIKRLMDIIWRLLQSSLLHRQGTEMSSDVEGKKKKMMMMMRLSQHSLQLKHISITTIHLLTEILSIFHGRPNRKSTADSPFSAFASTPPPKSSSSPVPSLSTPPSSYSSSHPCPESVDPTTFLTPLSNFAIVQCLVSWCSHGLMNREDLDLVQAIFAFFLKLAKSTQGAELLFSNGVNDQLGIYVHHLYSPTNLFTLSGKELDSTTSPRQRQQQISVYLLFAQMTTQMLVSLKAVYLEKALDFVGSHRGRFCEVLEHFEAFFFSSASRTVRSKSDRLGGADFFSTNQGVQELEVICRFVNELAKYKVEWRSRSPEVLKTIMTCLCLWTQKTVGLLLLPRLMQSIIESERSGEPSRASMTSWTQCRHFFTTDESTCTTPDLLKVQQKILSIIACNLSSMKRFSAPLSDAIYLRMEDLPTFESFILIDFSNPSIDEDSMPTFGMLVSIFSFCIDLISKSEGSRGLSPLKPSTPKPIQPGSLNKALITFAMDQALYLIMSHAALYLKDARVPPQEKQVLRSYLNNELSSCLNAFHRHFRTSSPSPVSARRSPVGVPAPLKFNKEHQFLSLADTFTRQVLT